MNSKRIARLALVVAVTAAVSVPVVSRVLRAAAPAAPPPGQPAAAPGAAGAPAVPGVPAAPFAEPSKTDAGHVIIQVGDDKLTVADFGTFITDSLPTPEQQAMARGPGRRELAEYLVRMKLLAREAQRQKLDQTDKVQRQLAMVRQQVLANAVVADTLQKLDPKAYLDQHRDQLERVAARHILVRTPGSTVPVRPGQKELTEEQAKARADEIVRRLRAGEDFAKVARAESDDTVSGANGGDLGSIGHGRMVPDFEKVVFGLKENEISQPVKTAFGWHVIQVTGRWDTPEKLAEQIRMSRIDEMLADLRKSGNVKLDEAYLGPELPDGPEPDLPPVTPPSSLPPVGTPPVAPPVPAPGK